MERELGEARRAHRAFVAAEARARELEGRRRAAVVAAIAAGASQSEVARVLGLHPSTVNRIVRGAGRKKRA